MGAMMIAVMIRRFTTADIPVQHSKTKKKCNVPNIIKEGNYVDATQFCKQTCGKCQQAATTPAITTPAITTPADTTTAVTTPATTTPAAVPPCVWAKLFTGLCVEGSNVNGRSSATTLAQCAH